MATGIPTNTSQISLPVSVSHEILQAAKGDSVIMQLARQTPLVGGGEEMYIIESDPQAQWVSETGEKPVSNASLNTKKLQPYKLAVISTFSKEFMKDADLLYEECVRRLPGALAKTIDQTVIGAVEKPGEDFDNLASATAQALVSQSGTVYGALVAARNDIANAGFSLNGFALSPVATGILLEAVDNAGRPLFLQNISEGAVGRVLGANVYEGRGMYKAGTAPVDTAAGTPAIVGIAGDWAQAVWGTVEGITLEFSEQATLQVGTTTVNLWQRNMAAVRAEIRFGFRANVNAFNLLLGATPEA